MIKESCNLIGQVHIFVYNLNYFCFASLVKVGHDYETNAKYLNQTYHALLPEVLTSKESQSMNGSEHFGLKLVKPNYRRYRICTGKKIIARFSI